MTSRHQLVGDRGVRRIRDALRATPLRPYERIWLRTDTPPDPIPAARAVLDSGWTFSGTTVSLTEPIRWEDGDDRTRSFTYRLHSWEPIDPLLGAHSLTREGAFFDAALRFALDWAVNHENGRVPSAFSWYDMGVGLRAHRLGYLLDAAARERSVSDADVSVLARAAPEHGRILALDEGFVAHNNHGLFQAIGQLSLAVRHPWLATSRAGVPQALERIRVMAARLFTSEGIYTEHSPGYHLMILSALAGILDQGLTSDDPLGQRRRLAEEGLAWFVLPNRTLAAFGDTDPVDLPALPAGRTDLSPALRFVRTGGTDGRPPAETVRAFPESGYIVIRDRWPDGPGDFGNCSYLAQMCAFHSRTHKHADDLTFVWYDRGRNLIVDAGRFDYLGRIEPDSELGRDGFWYSDPRRVFVESTRAHNTVEIDGRSHPRRVRPYGSALGRWGTFDGVTVVESQVRPRRTIRHVRVLAFMPGRWLLVFDHLWDNGGEPHRFRQWFHLAPELEQIPGEDGLAFGVPGSDPLRCADLFGTATLVGPVRGQDEPEMQGWWAPGQDRIEPNAAFAWEADGVSGHAFATLLAFAPSLEPETGWSASNRSGARFRAAWSDGSERWRLVVDRPRDGDLTCEWSRRPLSD